MGSANSTISAEPLLAAVAVAGVLGYGYVQYLQRTGGTDTDTNVNTGLLGLSKGSAVLHGQKKRGRKLQLPGDATLKNMDFLDSSAALLPPVTPPVPAPVTRQRQQQQTAPRPQQDDTVPGGFGGADTSGDALGAPRSAPPSPQQQQQQPEQSAGATSAPAGKAEKAQASAPAGVAMADTQDERWTRVEARKKREAVVAAGRTEQVADHGAHWGCLSRSSPDAPPRVAPVRPPPGEQPGERVLHGRTMRACRLMGDASSEDGRWLGRRQKPSTACQDGVGVHYRYDDSAAAADEETAPERAETRGAEGGETRAGTRNKQTALASHKRELEGVRRVDQAATPSKRTGSRYDSLDLH
ncbi:hypothetical protein EDB85DRAFT_2215289 [Lactarius pseudohatsudake]|nr:hypothetical protein EDB85DRAFT_2215289 [Lactarius pseudohatsudake]